MFTFYLVTVSEFAPDSHSVIKPMRVPITRRVIALSV